MSNVGQCCLVVAIKLILYLAYFTLGKWARDDSFLDTTMAMDRRAMVSKENEDLRAKEMHDERLLHSHKAQESRWSNKIPFRLGFWQC